MLITCFISTVEPQFVVRPVNTVAVKGIIAVLHCSFNSLLSTAISWSRVTVTSRVTSSTRLTERLIVDGCNVLDGYNDDYSVEYDTSSGDCDLVFNYVSLYLAGVYRCIESANGSVSTAKFTVLSEFCCIASFRTTLIIRDGKEPKI